MTIKTEKADAIAMLTTAAKVIRADAKNFCERVRKVEALAELTAAREDRDIIVTATDGGTVYYRVDRY